MHRKIRLPRPLRARARLLQRHHQLGVQNPRKRPNRPPSFRELHHLPQKRRSVVRQESLGQKKVQYHWSIYLLVQSCLSHFHPIKGSIELWSPAFQRKEPMSQSTPRSIQGDGNSLCLLSWSPVVQADLFTCKKTLSKPSKLVLTFIIQIWSAGGPKHSCIAQVILYC